MKIKELFRRIQNVMFIFEMDSVSKCYTVKIGFQRKDPDFSWTVAVSLPSANVDIYTL